MLIRSNWYLHDQGKILDQGNNISLKQMSPIVQACTHKCLNVVQHKQTRTNIQGTDIERISKPTLPATSQVLKATNHTRPCFVINLYLFGLWCFYTHSSFRFSRDLQFFLVHNQLTVPLDFINGWRQVHEESGYHATGELHSLQGPCTHQW